MNNAENSPAPDVELSEEDYHKLVPEVRKDRKAAVRAELLDMARTYVGRLICDCCERTLIEMGDPCRRPLKWHYRRLRRGYDSDPGYRNMINEFAEIRLIDQQQARPDDMTEQ